VSVVICCHNGAQRLPQTLAHLKAQKGTHSFSWEVLFIDNASTDGSPEVARQCWSDDHPARLRVVLEPRLGSNFARERGLSEARYEIVSFIDDDNWVNENWVSTVSRTMSTQPDIGALGGLIYPICETDPPPWFEGVKHRYAIITDADAANILHVFGLCGAGLSIRKTAWEELLRGGFRSRVTGRQGTRLSGGEDSEVTFALYLAGWRLCVDRSLRMYHFMPARRLTWPYLRRLMREGYEAGVPLDAYYFVDQKPIGINNRLRQFWLWHLFANLAALARHGRKTVFSLFCLMDGDPEVLEIEHIVGKMIGLLKLRSSYKAIRREVREAPWRKRESLRSP
jgi:glycosyltransferase involved in cell wall biosynthesis